MFRNRCGDDVKDHKINVGFTSVYLSKTNSFEKYVSDNVHKFVKSDVTNISEPLQNEISQLLNKRHRLFRSSLALTIFIVYAKHFLDFGGGMLFTLSAQTIFIFGFVSFLMASPNKIKELLIQDALNTNSKKYAFVNTIGNIKFTDKKFGLFRRIVL